MICKKCGKEVKEGNNFCTNCGKPVDNSIVNHKEIDDKIKIKSDNIIKRNLKIIIPIIVIIIVSIIVCVILKIGNNKNVESNGNNEIELNETSTTNIIETGAEYRCNTTGMVGFIKFNTDKDFIMQTGAENSELFTKTGTYKEKQNQIELTVNYNDELNNNTEEKKDIPYSEIIKILDNGDLEYVNEYNVTLRFSKNKNSTNEETLSGNLLDEIYAKYPELKDKEGIICTDGTDYWLLDENGKKVYFTDLESFEQAKEKCGLGKEVIENIDEESVATNEEENNITDEEKSNIVNEESRVSSSTSDSQNNQYITSDNDNNNYVDEMPSQWSVNIKISISNAYFNYNGQKCYPSNNFGTESISNANYFCYLQDPSTIDRYYLDKIMKNGRGVKYYINGNYLGDSSSESFNYTFNKNENVALKIVAPYIYDFSTGKVVATDVTVYEESDTAETLYKNRHDVNNPYISIPLPSLWN